MDLAKHPKPLKILSQEQRQSQKKKFVAYLRYQMLEEYGVDVF
jgi:hypothetical protein